MTRFEATLATRVAAVLGEDWAVETPKGRDRIIATHVNGSRTSVGTYGEDGRRNATDDDARRYADRLTRFLAGEVSKYTPEWADKGREALATLAVRSE